MSNMPSPKSLIAIISLGAVLGAAVVDFGRTAPGPLMAAHARIDGLADSGSCSDCHGGWTSNMTKSCLECHELIDIHIESGIGLHGNIDLKAVQKCAACHSEHHGETFMAVNDLSFARAGVPDRLEFDHEMIGWEMYGAHLALECTECHINANETVVPEGEHRYLGTSQSCVTCHEDVHEGTLQTDCVSCHSQESFDNHAYRGHDEFLPLIGGHSTVSCRECHAAGSTHSLEAHRGPAAQRPDARACSECHDVPHKRWFVNGAAGRNGVKAPAQLTGMAANVLCSDCHKPHHVTFQDDSELLTHEQHAASLFLLDEPHHEVSCDACHDPTLTYTERYPGRKQEQCIACHDDIHRGQFDGLAFASTETFPGGDVDEAGCLVCHAKTHFAPTTFDVFAHEDTDLPLEGAHVETDCNACHELDAQGTRVFHGVEHTCESCHEDSHLGFFDARLAQNPPVPFHGDCARCHDPNGFSPVDPADFDHHFWTGYPLEGAHAQTDCATCHEPSDEPDVTGRSLGRVSEVYGEVQGCFTCHDDVHEGLFDRKEVPARVEGRKDCARCHTPTSFRELPHGFEHGTWTGWELKDSHAEADCTACHAPLRRPDEIGRTWGRAAGRECSACHQSPHGDQFDVPFKKECTECHQSARAFSVLRFNHDLDSRFPLDDAHEEVACKECHKLDTEAGFIRYRPLPMECVDCHGVHESVLRRRRRNR
ncbi:MAG: hypothetical protein AAGI22_25225 [Planctomycetota bacterium]